MRICTIGDRLKLIVGEGIVDVERASGGTITASPTDTFAVWPALRSLAERLDPSAATEPFDAAATGQPCPTPQQVFAIALNYGTHSDESGIPRPTTPSTFTKFPTCLTGPHSTITLPSGKVDWEVELVVVIGDTASSVSTAHAWNHVAGLTVGQDITERALQFTSALPQFSLSKSFAGFGPIGPVIVTPDELDDRDDLALGCAVNGEEMQNGRTSDLIFPVAEIVSYLSGIVTLLPGDLIFTGTPGGIGNTRNPQRFLCPGDELVSWVEGIGEMRHKMVAAPSPSAQQ